MSTRRTPLRKRPSDQAAIAAQPPAAAAPSGADEAEGAIEREVRAKLLGMFEDALREESDMDRDGVEFLLGHFREAVEQASLAPTLDQPKPDRAEWIRTLDALIGQNVLSEDERNALVRQLDAAIDPLQQPDAQVAMEFARRVQRDGETKALEWLREQRAASAADAVDPAKSKAPLLPGRESITRSRSRRLRGPPQ
jgi:hypothetical protein